MRAIAVFVGMISLNGLPCVAVAQATQPAADTAGLGSHLESQRRERDIPGLAVGIVRGPELVYARAFGFADLDAERPVTLDTIFRIASVTKVFTTTLLAVLRDEGVVALDDPVAKHLPAGLKVPGDPRGAAAITLRHLATHTSGLPKLPGNVVPKDGDMYGGYTPEQLYAALPMTSLVAPVGARDEYSNFGMGLLGHVLERAAGKPFETLLRERVLEPLEMSSSGITLAEHQRRRAAVGHMAFSNVPAPEWDFGCLAGCGALASNVPDLAKFVSVQLRAGEADVRPIRGGTLRELHTPQHVAAGWEYGIGLGWHVFHNAANGNIIWHNGSTYGFGSFVAFIPKHNVGVVVLINRANLDHAADQLGNWLLDQAVARFSRAAAEPNAR